MAASADLARRLLEAALTAETMEEANLFREALDACAILPSFSFFGDSLW